MTVREAARLTFKLLRVAVFVVLVAPWVVAALLRAGGRFTTTPFRWARTLRLVFANRVSCPRGHQVALIGIWDCRCGARFAGHAHATCPICGERSGWVECNRCRLATRIS